MTAGPPPSLDGLRARLAEPEAALLGTFVLIPRIEVVELLGHTGFDLAILDLEHGTFGIEALPPLLAAAHGVGLACLVRVPDEREQPISAALDAGADGVLVPQVTSAAAAAAVVAAARFAPEGRRGANPFIRAAGHSADPGYLARANGRSAVIAMVEGRAGIEALDEILAVDGLDGVFLGPVDLSMALGLGGDPEHPDVVAAIGDVVRRAGERGVATGVFAPDAGAARRWRAAGVRLVAHSVDTALLRGAFEAAARAATSDADPTTSRS